MKSALIYVFLFIYLFTRITRVSFDLQVELLCYGLFAGVILYVKLHRNTQL